MQTVRWGIIGCGSVTEVKSGPGFQKAEGSSLVAVMRRNGELAKDYAERHGVPRWYDDGAALIADPEVDAVYIATPPSSHKQYTLMSAAAGKPVYVEKPMALSSAECQEMIAACAAAQVPLFVAYYRRALARFLKIKSLLNSGAIGEPRYLRINLSYKPLESTNALPWRVEPATAGGGFFVDLAAHMLDFLDDALGPIEEVRGFATNQAGDYAAEDMVSGSFRFASGVHGVGSWCFSSFEKTDVTDIVGTRGSLSYATFTGEPLELRTAAERSHITVPYPPHVQQPLIQTIVNELRGEGLCPSRGESAARTTRVMEELLRDYYAH